MGNSNHPKKHMRFFMTPQNFETLILGLERFLINNVIRDRDILIEKHPYATNSDGSPAYSLETTGGNLYFNYTKSSFYLLTKINLPFSSPLLRVKTHSEKDLLRNDDSSINYREEEDNDDTYL